MKNKRAKHISSATMTESPVIPSWMQLGRFFDLLLKIDKRTNPSTYMNACEPTSSSSATQPARQQ